MYNEQQATTKKLIFNNHKRQNFKYSQFKTLQFISIVCRLKAQSEGIEISRVHHQHFPLTKSRKCNSFFDIQFRSLKPAKICSSLLLIILRYHDNEVQAVSAFVETEIVSKQQKIPEMPHLKRMLSSGQNQEMFFSCCASNRGFRCSQHNCSIRLY